MRGTGLAAMGQRREKNRDVKLGFKKNNGTFKSPLTLSHCVCLLLCIAREMLFQRLDLILIFHLQGDDLLLNFALFHFQSNFMSSDVSYSKKYPRILVLK